MSPASELERVRAAILDVDGTLVDTNYFHVVAWQRAFRYNDIFVPAWVIHRHIGMGGDQLVGAVAGDEVEEKSGDDIRTAEATLYRQLMHETSPLPGGGELIRALKEAGNVVVLASSAKEYEVEHYLDLLEARDVADDWTTSADVRATKPNPDLVESALEKAGTRDAVMVGDTTWDCEAASRAGVASIGVLTGGFSAEELIAAGALSVYESPADLLQNLADSPFGQAA
jgi:HAD superfamily hydrolase (TIGR01549 family)